MLDRERNLMISRQIEGRGVSDKRVLRAMRRVPRHLFVPEDLMERAYDDNPLPIGYSQTISQPYIVALMTELCELKSHSRVLEIGSGCGYQSAILAEICSQVFAVEIVCQLAEKAKQTIDKLGYRNIIMRCGDGHLGWERAAPFDAILVAAAPEKIPHKLLDQLNNGGHLVIPVGKHDQYLKRITKEDDKFVEKDIIPVRFVPMTGKPDIANYCSSY